MTEYVSTSVVDHHCHGLVLRDLDRPAFEALMNEGPGSGRWTGSPFDSMLGLAIRRHCAPLLGLEPHADADTYLGRRQALGHDEVARRMLGAADIGTLILLVAYVLATVGCIKLLFIDKKMSVPAWEIVIPLAALLMLGYTIWRNVIPFPDANPGRALVIVAFGWVLLVAVLMVATPGLARKLSVSLEEADRHA